MRQERKENALRRREAAPLCQGDHNHGEPGHRSKQLGMGEQGDRTMMVRIGGVGVQQGMQGRVCREAGQGKDQSRAQCGRGF